MTVAYMAAVGSLVVLHQSACLVINCFTSCVSVSIINSLAKSNSLKSVYISTAYKSHCYFYEKAQDAVQSTMSANAFTTLEGMPAFLYNFAAS